jgi:hypothetical protein
MMLSHPQAAGMKPTKVYAVFGNPATDLERPSLRAPINAEQRRSWEDGMAAPQVGGW